MRIKIYSEERCPSCGRLEVSERVNRNLLIRIFLPNTRRMKCRRCLTRYLVRQERGSAEESGPEAGHVQPAEQVGTGLR